MQQPMQKFVSRPKMIDAVLGEHQDSPCYYTRFPTGLEFWIPKEAFEQDFMPLQCSPDLPDFQQRMFAEQLQLTDRIQSLGSFLESLDAEKMQELQISDLQLRLMETQLSAMIAYSVALLGRLQEMAVILA